MPRIRELRPDEVEFVLECHPEDIPYVGNCSAIDDDTDREAENWIRDQLDRGNEWAWCWVRVRARWNGFEGWDSLGGCSYLSEEDFRRNSMYFEGMKVQALADLNGRLGFANSLITA